MEFRLKFKKKLRNF